MSRCFPFPPPGYEKKLRVEDASLLAKDKDKEKKHKKDKDKEKKDGRGKSKEQNKEKHKHKDRDKKEGKKRSRDEKRFEGNFPTVEKIGSNSPESSCAQELEPRINFVDTATGGHPGAVSRSNVVYRTEPKNVADALANGQGASSQSRFPKIVFSNGGEQRKVRIGRPVENHINESTAVEDVAKHHSSIRKGEKSKEKNAKRHKEETETLKTKGYNGAQIDVSRVAASVQELDRRVNDENGATGSQFGAKANIITQVQDSVKPGNDNVISSSQIKPSPKLENDSYRLDNGQKDNNHSKVAKVSIVQNFKTEERGRDVAGAVDTKKMLPLEGMERNRYRGKDNVENGKKLQSKDEDRNNPIKDESVKKESVDVVKLSRTRQNGSDITESNKHFLFKMSDNTSEVICGKRKEPEANGILHGEFLADNQTRPSKLPRTSIPSSQPSTKSGRNLTSTTITFSASKQVSTSSVKLDGEEHKSIRTVSAQSPLGSNKPPSMSAKSMGPTRSQSPLGLAKPSIPSKANAVIGAQGSPFGPTKPPLSIGEVPGKTGYRESHLSTTKPPSTAEKVYTTTTAHGHGSPPSTANVMPQIAKPQQKVNYQESAKPPLTPRKDNGTVSSVGLLPTPTKAILPHIGKAPETVGCKELAKPPLTPGKVAGTVGPHESPSVTKKPPSTSKKERRKEKSSKPRSPHPDTKYLSQILSLPKMEELSEFDDPDWLFESKCCSSKEPDASEDGGEQVWSKGVHIKSADVFALPYVIPY